MRISTGNKTGIIIATIITVHMPRNVPAAVAHDWPGMRIQAMDIVQPPGISMPGIAAMEEHQATVTATLVPKASAAATMKVRSAFRVFVMALPPDTGLVASQRCPV